MFCEKCGNKISESDKFCNVGGASLQGTPSTNTNKAETIGGRSCPFRKD